MITLLVMIIIIIRRRRRRVAPYNEMWIPESKKFLLVASRIWENLLVESAILLKIRLQNSPYFCVFKYARAVKQNVWSEAENRERDWGETLTPRFTDCFTDFEKKTDCFAVYLKIGIQNLSSADKD